ncbi:hypothetical protein BKA70DRAFT_1566915 [Coprinopsis sp. MPI-PUGE-AT-0042]|nr:hypothetical protein BKA70DRAFT_1566915 [Coprinopsis sp. MPI-PUGE-AT-0042]
MSIMDTTGFSQVGKFGTLSLMKKNEEAVITSFGIDTEELTFGRDPACSVRLYYPDVSLVHCKIVFEERKAFLAILGDGGLVVDGCEVYPNTGSNGAPTMVPLTNNSEIVIRQKRFRFTYPPKDMRATLFNTPSPSRNRKLRLSMIHSAQVFTPRPSNDPRENLRVLQSPMKNQFKSPMKPSLLSRAPQIADDEEEEEEIVLVDGNHPRVVEEDRDLVILEDVPTQIPLARPTPNYPPKTPPRRKSRITLHRAVLIRSAQRAVIRAEEEEEEQEVLESVVAEDEDDQDNFDDEFDEDGDADAAMDEDEDVEMEDVVSEPEQESESSKPGWRKSLGRIWPFTGGAETKDGEEQENDDDDEMEEGEQEERQAPAHQNSDSDEYDDDDSENFDAGPAPLPAMPLQTPARRPLGSFLTPQIKQGDRPSPSPFGGRLSLGGGPRRELVEQPWRVKDLVVAQEPESSKQAPEPQAPIPDTPRRAAITEEERSAIRERRRSAVRQPDNFFPGGVPGLSPKKPTMPVSPIKPSIPLNPSPIKGTPSRRTSADDELLDTRSLLEKMKETVETMKRRKSVAPTAGMDATPQQPLPTTPKASGPLAESRTSVKKLYLDAGPSNHSDNPFAPEDDEGPTDTPPSDDLAAMEEDEPAERSFSLLTPMARRNLPAMVRVTAATPVATPTRVNPPPRGPTMDVDEEVRANESGHIQGQEEPMDEEPSQAEPPSRLLRPKKIVPTPSDDERLPAEPEPETVRRRRSPRPRSRSPQPPAEEESEEEVHEEKAPAPRATTTRRTRTTEPSTSKTPAARPARVSAKEVPEPAPARRGRRAASNEPTVAVEKPAPARRGRKPASVQEDTQGEMEAEASAPALKRGGRKTPASQLTADEESEDNAEEQPAGPAPTRKGRITRPPVAAAAAKKRAAQAAAARAEELDDDDDDPLDALTNPPRALLPSAKAKGKKKAVVKEEDDDSSTTSSLSNTATTTATKPAPRGRAAGSTLKTPAPVATKARTTRKTPATAPSAIGGGRNKENSTPAASGSGGGSGSGPSTETEAMVKLKVSRSRGKVAAPAVAAAGSSGARSRSKAAAAVKQEPEEEPKTRATRSTRARTKTG